MAAKLALIDPGLLIRLINNPRQLPVDPTLRELNSTEQQMDNALLKSKGSVKEINKLLNQRNIYADKFQNYHPPQTSVIREPESQRRDTDIWEEKIIDTLPKTTKQLGHSLLSHIKSSQKINWNDRGQVIIDGNLIPNTNILDLVHSVIRIRKTKSPPVGSREFTRALTELNTPSELFRNQPVESSANKRIILTATRRRSEEPAIKRKKTFNWDELYKI